MHIHQSLCRRAHQLNIGQLKISSNFRWNSIKIGNQISAGAIEFDITPKCTHTQMPERIFWTMVNMQEKCQMPENLLIDFQPHRTHSLHTKSPSIDKSSGIQF